jgi:cell growth-regulating nucleolar protein
MANGTKVNPRISRLLERIAQYPNIPRKRAKFENFVKNSVNIRDQATLGELWDIFSTAIKQTTTVVETESSSRVIATEGNEQNEADRSVVAENGEPSHKEKKKKKKESVGVETCDAPDTDSEQNQTKTTKKKKKKRVDESVETCDIDYEQVRTKKKKKRKHKEEVETIQACNAEVEEDNSTPTAVEEMEVSVEKKKKLKRAAASSATVAEVDDSLPNGDLKKKKKTKSKEQIDASGVERGDDLVGVGPMEVAVEYISGHHNNSIADDAETKPKKAKKKRKSERETFIGEEMLKHKHK